MEPNVASALWLASENPTSPFIEISPDALASSSAWQQASRKMSRRDVCKLVETAEGRRLGARRKVCMISEAFLRPDPPPAVSLPPLAADILAFWFPPGAKTERDVWFRKDDAFDREIRERFGAALAAGIAGAFGEWCTTAHGSLARVLLLDQFTRNAFRGTPDAFAGDARALATAQAAIDRGFESALYKRPVSPDAVETFLVTRGPCPDLAKSQYLSSPDYDPDVQFAALTQHFDR